MRGMNAISATRKTVISLLALALALFASWAPVVQAQSDFGDFEAPSIEHDEDTRGRRGAVENFIARVTDNERLASVHLYYRYNGEQVPDADYIEVDMQPIKGSDFHSADIDTSDAADEASVIEYYIRAEDVSGNVVLKGFAFRPLERILDDPTVPVDDALVTEAADTSVDTSGGKLNWWLVGLGVLAVGGLAAVAADGGGSSDCNPCVVTLDIEPPR